MMNYLSKILGQTMDQACSRNADLSAYVDGELSNGERRRIEAHLASCGVCQGSLQDLRELKQAFQSLPLVAVGFDLTPLIQVRLAHIKPENRLWLAIRKIGAIWPVPIAAACTLLMGILLGSIFVNKLDSAIAVPGSRDMAIFDVMPPGGLCVGMKSCHSQVEL